MAVACHDAEPLAHTLFTQLSLRELRVAVRDDYLG